MDAEKEVLSVLTAVLNMNEGQARLTPQSRLLGHIPELDSMAVLTILTSLEERLGVAFEDDEIDGTSFESVQSIVALVRTKLAG